jgi:hypothetical protein
MSLPVYDYCTFWIAHQFKENGKPSTTVLLDFGFMGLRPRTLDIFNFEGRKPYHRLVDDLNDTNWRRFVCRFGRDETYPFKLTQPWFANALVYVRRQNVVIKQTDIFNLYSPSGQAELEQFSNNVSQFYHDDTMVLHSLSQLQQLQKTHRSIIIHLTKTELEQDWLRTSAVLQKLRTGEVTGYMPQSILLLSTQPLPNCGRLSGGRIELLNLDKPIFLGDG